MRLVVVGVLLSAGLALMAREGVWRYQASKTRQAWRAYTDAECEALCATADRLATRAVSNPYWLAWYRLPYGIMKTPEEFRALHAKRIDVVPTAVVATLARWDGRAAVLNFVKLPTGKWSMVGEIGGSDPERISIWPRTN